ncbi:MAG: hypothetical protein AAFP07_22575, partial [Cyanobacteria bacterium J06606_4]
MLLSGFFAEPSKGYVTLPFTSDDSSFGTAAAQFDGDSGTYDVIVTYFDEADGEAPFAFKLNGSTVDGWIADKKLGSTVANNKSRTTRTISNVALSKGDLIELTAQEHEGELGRIDSVEFVEVQPPAPNPNPNPNPIQTRIPIQTRTNPNPNPNPSLPLITGLSIEAEDMLLSGFFAEPSK